MTDRRVHTITVDGEMLVFSAGMPIPDDEVLEIVRKYDRVVIEWMTREEFHDALEGTDE